MPNVLDLDNLIERDSLATEIANKFTTWNMQRQVWLEQKRELRNYIFATDTSTTTNAQLQWRNTTTVPKLCQIRDNLHANYMAALFPNSNWLDWEGANEAAELKEKREVIKQYMDNKLRLSKFVSTVGSQLVYDYIDYGNAFATTEYIREEILDPVTGEVTQGYVGPKAVRVSPYDIVFDPTAASFRDSPKIIRSLMTLGDLKKMVQVSPENAYMEAEVDKLINERRDIQAALNNSDVLKGNGYQADGFDDYKSYYASSFVEVLNFYGDMFDMESGELLENYIITVVDGTKVVRKEPSPSWLGSTPIQHVGWRLRPDNLYAMGPLDNLVGMQYRIDHLENIKADVFDLIAYPVVKVKGDVENFNWQPMEKIYLGDEGDVALVSPDANALNADMEIALLENKMEELAGAPRQAMGIRTPGEKTAFEVQKLDNATGRIFSAKTLQADELLFEPLYNDMLESARRNLDGNDILRVFSTEDKVTAFLSITKEDLSADGRLVPVGSRHFAEQAQLIQNLNGFFNSAVGQDEFVRNHFSGKKIALMMEQLLDLGMYDIVSDNVRVFEAADTQRLANSAQEQVGVEQLTPSGITEDDVE